MKVIEELLPQLVLQSAATIPRSTALPRRAMTEEERFLVGPGGAARQVNCSPLVQECKSFIPHIVSYNGTDPVEFWTKSQAMFPILAPVARRVLAVPATSASTERLFSASSRVCTFDRASLKPANVDILTTLHVWETFALEEDSRARKRRAANDLFCCVKIDVFTIILTPALDRLYVFEDFGDDEE